MKRAEIIQIICDYNKGKLPIISSTGLISREIYNYDDRSSNFYMVGSMGLASSIGFGLAMNIDKKVIVIEGDASILMNLGSLASIGYHQPGNMIHIVLDNGAYASCSEEKSISPLVRIDQIAAASGYKHVYRIDTRESLIEALGDCHDSAETSFILVEMELGGSRDLPRPKNLVGMTERFLDYVNN